MEVGALRYRDAFTHAGSGMALLAADGTWLVANPAMARLLREPVEALAGQPAHAALFGSDFLERLAPAAGNGTAGPAATAELELPDASGRRHWRARLTQLQDGAGSPAAMLLQLDDISGEQALRREQDLLAYGISHDLRAPLRSIAGFAAQLDEAGVAGSTEAASSLARIRAAASRAEGLIDELLELSRSARQPFRDEVVDMSLLGEWVGAELRDTEPARQASITVAPGLFAEGDEHWLRRALQKVLGNAWKFSAGRDRVEIAMTGQVRNGRLEIEINDQGCGFDMRYADKLFQPFQKLHGEAQGAGNGLGLAIARQIVERHGGRMWADARPGEGSSFYIELPAATGCTP